ncbi:MAG: DegV family protein [Actinomycetota bacterium]|nr:DegV family protein [Actinomycetota bacterium]
MREIAIVTDSTSDLPRSLYEEHGITVVPLALTIDGETFTDGDLSQEEFFRRMNAAKELPTTSQPSPGIFVEAYARVLETARSVISVHISSDLSGTFESATQAAREFPGRVHLVDSRNLSMALGLQVIEAARAVARGLSVDEVVAHVENARDRVQLLVGVDKLDNLAKGGRIGRVGAFIGGMLNLRVLFTVADGVFDPVGRIRGAQTALNRTLEWVGERMGNATGGKFCVLHAMSLERAEWLRDQLTSRYLATDMYVVETGTVISTHTGTGWGVAFIPEE